MKIPVNYATWNKSLNSWGCTVICKTEAILVRTVRFPKKQWKRSSLLRGTLKSLSKWALTLANCQPSLWQNINAIEDLHAHKEREHKNVIPVVWFQWCHITVWWQHQETSYLQSGREGMLPLKTAGLGLLSRKLEHS